MSEFTPISEPANAAGQIGRLSPNAYEHKAVHPAVYTVRCFISVSSLAQNFLKVNTDATIVGSTTDFSVWDFALYRQFSVWLNVDKLSDLVLEVENDVDANFDASLGHEERRWALNIGQNFIEYSPTARYGRLKIVNRAGSALAVYGEIGIRSVL